MSDPILHHETISTGTTSPARWLYVLHGIFGMGRNWASIARRIVRERPDWGAVLVDLREHGRSRGFTPPHTLAAAAADVAALAERLGHPPGAILGHSFGGKVALTVARDFPGLVSEIWVIDSTPEARTEGGAAVAMLEVVRRQPGPFESRESAIRALEGEGVATPVAQWMGTNLGPSDHGVDWRLDFDALEKLLRDFGGTDLWDVVESPPGGSRIHFVKASESDLLRESACDRIEAAGEENDRVRLHRVAGGHWLNADNPEAVGALLVENLGAG